jgi:pre-mRNA-splicing helicase BRR2
MLIIYFFFFTLHFDFIFVLVCWCCKGWWLVVGSEHTDEVVALKRLTLASTATINLSMNTPSEPGTYEYAVFLISDVYLGLDQQINFKIVVS